MINWNDSDKEIPEDNSLVWVLLCHWKEKKPGSYELEKGKVSIAGGTVETYKELPWLVCTQDDDGAGSNCFYPYTQKYIEDHPIGYHDQVFTHWCYVNEINVPNDDIK